MVFSGPYDHYEDTECVYRSQQEAIEWCKQQFRTYRLRSWDEDRGWDSDERLININTYIVEITGRSRRLPVTVHTFTVQLCTGMSLALHAYLASGHESLDELWVSYYTPDQKIWRLYVDEEDAGSYRNTEHPDVLDRLAIKGVPFQR